jgi:hypothetical protein
MRVWTLYILLFIAVVLGFVILIKNAPNPEKIIIGEWQETIWEYEKTNENGESYSLDKLAASVKDLSGQNLIIHKAEEWEFSPNRRLKLTSEDGEKIVSWRIKGRGHILQLKYDGSETEQYNLTELTRDRMVLNFDSDIQARGIAKLTFEKKTNN